MSQRNWGSNESVEPAAAAGFWTVDSNWGWPVTRSLEFRMLIGGYVVVVVFTTDTPAESDTLKPCAWLNPMPPPTV